MVSKFDVNVLKMHNLLKVNPVTFSPDCISCSLEEGFVGNWKLGSRGCLRRSMPYEAAFFVNNSQQKFIIEELIRSALG